MLDTPHKKKSLAITIALHLLLLLLLFFFGLSYLEPDQEQGIAINFGIAEVGSGQVQPLEPIKADIQEEVAPEVLEQVEEVIQETIEEQVSEPSSDSSEEVVTQDNNLDTPVIKDDKKNKLVEKVEEVKKEAVKEVKEKKKEVEKKEDVKKEVKKEKPKPVVKKPDAATKNALDSFLNGPKSEGTKSGGDGDDKQAGDKGGPDGDPVSKSYYKNGKGLDGDGNYRLGGRKALNKEKKIPVCNETGTVVVKIVVDQNGKVIQALPGIKGSTNTADCLMKPAKEAALATKFNSDSDAPAKQIGSIVYTFKLSE